MELSPSLALPFDGFVILDKSLNLSGLPASLYAKGLDLVTHWGRGWCPRRLPWDPGLACALSSRFPQELLTPAQHLPKPPTPLTAAACIALEPGGAAAGLEGLCGRPRKQGSVSAGEHSQGMHKQLFSGPQEVKAPTPEAHCLPGTHLRGSKEP